MNYIHFISLLLFCFTAVLISGCEPHAESNAETRDQRNKVALTFPDDVFGIYQGTLNITNPRGEQTIPMEFHLLETDSIHQYDYILIYSGQPRNYTLIAKDLEKGVFELDENNGIILPTYFNKNTLHSFFEVNDNLLSSRLQFFHDRVDFEILFASNDQNIQSGSGGDVKVLGIPISTFQKASLYKQ
ncbi:MAG: hypothetical protein AAFP70_10600 [Calditrichota bacterium]